jgi:KaiC/GvpD/RAD55 family RecA-like ATPase
MSQFFKTLKKAANNEFAFTIDEENPYEVDQWIDTGCYALNAVLSDGDIMKGIPMGKRVMISGESGVAKSLFVSIIIKAFLNQVENSSIVFFESEASTVIEMAKQIGIPDDKILILPVQTVEEFRTQATNIIDKVIERNAAVDAANIKIEAENEKARKFNKKTKTDTKKEIKKLKQRENVIMVIDSLGNLGTIAESKIISTDKRSKVGGPQTRDMTRAQLIRGMSRTISLKIAMAQIPLILVNHTYKVMSEYAEDETSGGGGVKYMSDISLVLTKAKEKDGSKKQIGIMITLKTRKSRYMKENKEVKVLISFSRGMYRMSDLVNKGAELKVLKKDGQSYILPDGNKIKMKEVRQKASQYICGETLELIRQAIKDDFGFGTEDGKFDFFDDMEEDIDDRSNSEVEDDIDRELEA